LPIPAFSGIPPRKKPVAECGDEEENRMWEEAGTEEQE
jgi:hypothetical protein